VTDVLVRDVPEDVVAAVNARAARLGLSRREDLRRRLAQEAVTTPRAPRRRIAPSKFKHCSPNADSTVHRQYPISSLRQQQS
jgi:plasmid stability protein